MNDAFTGFVVGILFTFIMCLVLMSDMTTTKTATERCMTYHKTQTVEQARAICKAIVKGEDK